MTYGEEVKFQLYAFDPYLRKNVSAIQLITPGYETTPLGKTLTDYFQKHYRGIHKLIQYED